jgi:hypothetical protein
LFEPNVPQSTGKALPVKAKAASKAANKATVFPYFSIYNNELQQWHAPCCVTAEANRKGYDRRFKLKGKAT